MGSESGRTEAEAWFECLNIFVSLERCALENGPTFKIWSNWPIIIGWIQPVISVKTASGFL